MAKGPIFLHSMYRTGSTFLAGQYVGDSRYQLFYEPFNSIISSQRLLHYSIKNHEEMARHLRHSPLDGGYFGVYVRNHPTSGRALHKYYKKKFVIDRVYNTSRDDDVIQYLSKCIEYAEVNNTVPVFGFCASGTQVRYIKEEFGGKNIYLYRDPRFQFASYSPLSNDFFLPHTILQLATSEDYSAIVRAILPLAAYESALIRLTARALPIEAVARRGRYLASRIDMQTAYKVFYLAWLLAVSHGKKFCEYAFTMNDAFLSSQVKAEAEAVLGVSLDGVRQLDFDQNIIPLPYDAIEAEVEARCAEHGLALTKAELFS